MIRLPRCIARALASDRRGITTIEFGLVALPLCMLLFAVVEIGMAVRVKSALQYATSQAARCAVVNAVACGTSESIQAYAVSKSMGVSQISTSSFTVTTTTCGKQVSASVAFPVVAHRVIPTALTLTAKSCYPI